MKVCCGQQDSKRLHQGQNQPPRIQEFEAQLQDYAARIKALETENAELRGTNEQRRQRRRLPQNGPLWNVRKSKSSLNTLPSIVNKT